VSVEIPKAAVVFGSVAPPQGDVIELRVHLGCTKEVSSFECLLQNWDKKYSPSGTYPINVGMELMWGWMGTSILAEAQMFLNS